MKMLVINGSPRGEKGATYKVHKAFERGVINAGVNVKTMYLCNMNIIPCCGYMKCLDDYKCVFDNRDDYKLINRELENCDFLVLCTPVYFYNVTSIMKSFIDRTFQVYGYKSRHEKSLKYNYKLFLILVGGLDNRKIFESILSFMKNIDNTICGIITRTMSELLIDKNFEKQLSWYFSTVEKAGFELIKDGFVSDSTNNILNKDIIMKGFYQNLLSKRGIIT